MRFPLTTTAAVTKHFAPLAANQRIRSEGESNYGQAHGYGRRFGSCRYVHGRVELGCRSFRLPADRAGSPSGHSHGPAAVPSGPPRGRLSVDLLPDLRPRVWSDDLRLALPVRRRLDGRLRVLSTRCLQRVTATRTNKSRSPGVCG